MKPSKPSVEKQIQGIQYDASLETHDKIAGHVLSARPSCSKNNTSASALLLGSLILISPFRKLAIAAVLIAAWVFGFQHMGSNSIAWADGVAQFNEVPYFNATVYIKDAGGQAMTPEDIFAKRGYHLPENKHVGITPDDAVWFISDRGRNKMSNGRRVYGFSQLKDDLGVRA